MSTAGVVGGELGGADRRDEAEMMELAASHGSAAPAGFLLKPSPRARAILIRSNLSRAEMDRASFTLAHLERAPIKQASLVDATFWAAFLADASLAGSDLRGASSPEADLTGADLSSVVESEAVSSGPRLVGASAISADVRDR